MKLILTFLFIFSLDLSYASKLKITDLVFSNRGERGKVSIQFQGPLKKSPELTIKKDILQVSMFDAIVWPQVSKKITLQRPNDSELKAYQFDKETVRVRAILPFPVQGLEKKVNLVLQDNSVELYFPINSKQKGGEKKEYDETYLDYLLQQKDGNRPNVFKGEVGSDIAQPAQDRPGVLQDKVQMTQSAPQKRGTKKESLKAESGSIIERKSFDAMSYIGKYIVFLGIILLAVYGVVLIFKRRVLKKGRLGFLNNTDLVSVLNTTYLGPKRSLLVVKVHDKVLLLGNSETGLNYLSELEGVSDLLKEGEKEVAGSNFDSTVGAVKEGEVVEKVKIKENPLAGQENTTPARDEKKSSLSEQIKQKVKDLRPLQ